MSIKDVKDLGAGQVLRLALMSAHYKQPLDWNEKLFQDCQNTIQKWYDAIDKENYLFAKKVGKKFLNKNVIIPNEILEPLYDDLNTPGYIANLHKLFDKTLNGNEKDKEIFISACNFIGLLIESKEDWEYYRFKSAKIEAKDINERVKLMDKARENKDYLESDKIRKELQDIGIVLENKDGRTIWKLK